MSSDITHCYDQMLRSIEQKAENIEVVIPIRILRLKEVMRRVGICRASIYQHMRTGHFPRNIILGPRAVGWLETDINEWLAERIRTSTVNKS